MSFDEIIDRRGTGCNKWDRMEALYGVSPDDGLAMWVADMDFRSPEVVRDAVRRMGDFGVFGYRAADERFLASIAWWMKARHGWTVNPKHILTAHGICNGLALLLDTFTAPGDGVAVMSPVYLEFGQIVRGLNRRLLELPLEVRNGLFEMDFAAWDLMMTGDERVLILCSPHNPGGRVWTEAELQEVARFVRRHDLLLVCDEIHHDLVFPGQRHTVMPRAAPGIEDRLVMLTSASKTFNIAGSRTGNAIIADDTLRRQFKRRLAALSIQPNLLGLVATEAAYSPDGAAWLDELVRYLDGNARLFADRISEVPGVSMMPMEATYLAWVDFARTGLDPAEVTRRVERDAKIAASRGPTFGRGGETWLRFNLGMPRSLVADAVGRLQHAFADVGEQRRSAG